MSKMEDMPKLSDVLREVDRNRVLSDLRNKHYHQVTYNNSRTILKYVEEDVVLTAYAYNPGNAIVVFEKKNGLIAYSCYFDGFPNGESYSCFHWTKMDMNDALILIKEDKWEDSDYIEDIDYKDTSYSADWPVLACGKIQYITSYSGNNADITIEEYLYNEDNHIFSSDFTIKRLKSGRLRVELNGSHFPYEQIVDVMTFFEETPDTSKQRVGHLPSMGSWRKVISITEIEKDISRELKAQVLTDKMKEAA